MKSLLLFQTSYWRDFDLDLEVSMFSQTGYHL